MSKDVGEIRTEEGSKIIDNVTTGIQNRFPNLLLSAFLKRLGPEEARAFILQNGKLITAHSDEAVADRNCGALNITQAQFDIFIETIDAMKRRGFLRTVGGITAAVGLIGATAQIVMRGQNLNKQELQVAGVISGVSLMTLSVMAAERAIEGAQALMLSYVRARGENGELILLDNTRKTLEPMLQDLRMRVRTQGKEIVQTQVG